MIMTSTCCICLINTALHKLNHPDGNGTNWLKKLQTIVPELELVSSKFVDDWLICECCIDQIEGILKFRNYLIELIGKLKLQIQKETIIDGFQNASYLNDTIEHQQLRECFQDHIEGTCNTFEYSSSCDVEIAAAKQDIVPLVTFSTEIIQNHLEEEGNSEIKIHKFKQQCTKCSETFTCDRLLRIHEEVHEKNIKSPFACKFCNEFHATQRHLKLHKKSCAKYLDGRSQKVQKGIKKKSTNKYSCEICDLKFDYIKDIITHCKTVHSMNEKAVKPYFCGVCSCRFTSFSNYSQHQKYHEGIRDHICSLCGKTFITKSDLMVHEYIHLNRRNYKCQICEKAFNTNKNLRTHHLVVHTDHLLWKHECLICGKRFPLKGNFDQHMKRHSGDKQYICHVCEKSFVSGTELKRHVSLHSNIRAFSCAYCSQEYKTLRTLNIHLRRTHSKGNAKLPLKERKYVCHICPSQFYDKQKLTRHMYGHSGVKPFSCHTCDKKFTDKSYLSHHLQIAHNISENSLDTSQSSTFRNI